MMKKKNLKYKIMKINNMKQLKRSLVSKVTMKIMIKKMKLKMRILVKFRIKNLNLKFRLNNKCNKSFKK